MTPVILTILLFTVLFFVGGGFFITLLYGSLTIGKIVMGIAGLVAIIYFTTH